MREERGNVPGGIIFSDAVDLWGSVGGNASVIEGGKVYIRGAVYGHLNVENGGRVHIFGVVQGNLLVHKGAKVIHSGNIGGDAINLGGRLYVDKDARVAGKIKPKKGETRVNGHLVEE